MAARSITTLPGGEVRVRGPGVTVEKPMAEAPDIQGVSQGTVGFLGYARLKGKGQWPLTLTALDQIPQRLELPEWGFLHDALRAYFRNGGQRCSVVGIDDDHGHNPDRVVGGGGPGQRRGLAVFDSSELVEILCFPDLFRVPPGAPAPALDLIIATHRAITDFCAGLKEASRGGYFALLDAPPGLNERQASLYASQLRASPTAEFAALYYPWVQVDDRAGGLKSIPPSGAVAGIYNSLSSTPEGGVGPDHGPQMAAANRALADAISAERSITRGDSWKLMEAGLNPLVPWPGRGMVVWGARTISQNQERNHVAVRRILSYVRRSVHLGTQWAVFEPNTPILWLRLTAYVQDFLRRLWEAGILVGPTVEDAYAVRCDRSTNPQREVDAGRLNMLIAVRPTRSLEHIVIRIFHESAQSSSDAGEG